MLKKKFKIPNKRFEIWSKYKLELETDIQIKANKKVAHKCIHQTCPADPSESALNSLKTHNLPAERKASLRLNV